MSPFAPGEGVEPATPIVVRPARVRKVEVFKNVRKEVYDYRTRLTWFGKTTILDNRLVGFCEAGAESCTFRNGFIFELDGRQTWARQMTVAEIELRGGDTGDRS